MLSFEDVTEWLKWPEPLPDLVEALRAQILKLVLNRTPLDEIVDLIPYDMEREYKSYLFFEAARGLRLRREKHALDALDYALDASVVMAHNYATLLWIRGCLLWETGHQEDAVNEWYRTLQHFRALVERTRQRRESISWYNDRIHEMEESVAEAVSKIDTQRIIQAQQVGVRSAPVRQKGIKLPISPGTISIFPVAEVLPAGSFRAVSNDPNIISHVGLHQVMIDDKLYQVYNLLGSGQVRLNSLDTYIVIKVNGDSMNKMGIEDGDYVLLREAADARNQDIVAAQVLEEEPQATLKRYIKRSGKIILRPESTNPTHSEYEFTAKDANKFSIRGVAVAVFKPSVQ